MHNGNGLPVLRDVRALERVRQQLVAATSVDEVKDIRDKAEAIRLYYKKAGLGLDSMNAAAEVKLRAERRCGELLGETVQHGGDRKSKYHEGSLKLDALGISHNQSSRWQRLAAVPEDEFEQHVLDFKSDGKELTTASVMRLGKQHETRQTFDVDPASLACHGVVSSLQELVDAGAKFPTIYADPPWQYANKATRSAVDREYKDTMSLDEICAEPVAKLAADQAHLHLWTTNGFLPDAFRVIEAWGFTYKSCFVWVKGQMGIGNYWRVSHEFMLLGVRGSLRFRDKGQKSWLEVDRTKHSRKPREVRELIEKVSPGPYLEMYGREVIGAPWTVYGNEIERGMFSGECL